MYKLSITALPFVHAGVHRWCLDFPTQGEAYTSESLLSKGIMFQGWVLDAHDGVTTPFVKIGGEKRCLSLDRLRPDVIARVLKEDPNAHERLSCGFRALIDVSSDELIFGFEIDGRDYQAVKVSVLGAFRIIQGQDGWLFLDNDTNRSVEQFRGEYLLEKSGLLEWHNYLEQISSLAEREGFMHSVLVAPAKELVLSDFYPYRKGGKTPIEQIEDLALERHNLVHPVADLQSMTDRPFRKCDTHWSHKGALVGFLASLRPLGIDSDAVAESFSDDLYLPANVSGDLGNKVFPPQSASELMLRGVPYRNWIVYDNGLPNLGRVIVFNNQSAMYSAKCLIFGSSSSYSFFAFIARVFSTVIFVHSAGSIDLQVISDERPDYLIAQTNGRFVVRPPTIEYSLAEEIADKWERLDSASRARVTDKYLFAEEGTDSTSSRFHRMLPFVG